MRSKSRVLLVALAAVVLVLALAAPALAASNVAKGNSQLLVPKAKVTELQGKYTTINAFNEIKYKPRWSGSSLTWWFSMPVWTKIINDTYYTSYNVKTGKGTFYHSGQFVVVNAGSAVQKGLKWQGIRIVALGKNSYQLIATVGNQKPYVPNVVLAQSTSTTKITHSGKAYHIDGIKFYLTPTAAAQLTAAISTTVATNTILFTGDLYFTMK